MKPLGIGLLVGVCLALVGCGSKPTVVGKWKVDPALVSSPPAGMSSAMMTGFATTFKYEFKPDNTFTGFMKEGTYTLDGAKLSMTTKTLAGQDISKIPGAAAGPQMTGDLAPDGQSMILHIKGAAAIMPGLADMKMVPDK